MYPQMTQNDQVKKALVIYDDDSTAGLMQILNSSQFVICAQKPSKLLYNKSTDTEARKELLGLGFHN